MSNNSGLSARVGGIPGLVALMVLETKTADEEQPVLTETVTAETDLTLRGRQVR